MVQPVIDLLKQGITPEQIGLSLALGVTVGVIPVLGTTTILCTIIALSARLNLPAIQATNWLVYPLQLILLIPFFRFGEWLFRAPPLPISPEKLVAMFKTDLWNSIVSLWDTTLHALVAWLLVAPALTIVVYFALLPLLKRMPLPAKAAVS